MKDVKNMLWGIIFILIGIIIGLNSFGLTNISIFFDGWWTLFIIVPCLLDLFNEEEDKTGNGIGLGTGILLFLGCQDFIDFSILWKLFVPFILVFIGVSFIFKDNKNRKLRDVILNKKTKSMDIQEVYATFSAQKLNYQDEEFTGCDLNAIFGAVECDLRGSVISGDTIIRTTSIFGGIDIFVPDDVVVKVTSNSVFGGVTNKLKSVSKEGKKTIYIQATCIFGGVEIK